MRYKGKNIHIMLSVVVMFVTFQLSKIAIPSSPQASVIEPVATMSTAFFDKTASAASYSESNHSWTLSAKVLQIRDVSIYGRPGSIAKIEYMHKGRAKHAWAAVKIEDYSFSDSTSIAKGDDIILQVSGKYVSSKGVDWLACQKNDWYCQNASFIEGGFPVSEDFGGLTISPSNRLIYWGSVGASNWGNGILAWKIITNSVIKTPPQGAAEEKGYM